MSDDDDRAQRTKAAGFDLLQQVLREPDPVRQFARYKAELCNLPEDIRDAVVTFANIQEQLMNNAAETRHSTRRDRIGAFIGGAIGLAILLTVAIFIPSPTQFQERIFGFVLGVSVAFAGAFLPGTIEVSGEGPGWKVRAAGAIGLLIFALLFYRFILP